MKMLVITSVREDMQLVTDILQKSKIEVFSVSETIGHKASHQDYPISNWFGRNDLATDALFFFSFTEDNKGEEAIRRSMEANEAKKREFPVHAFLLPVDSSTYPL